MPSQLMHIFSFDNQLKNIYFYLELVVFIHSSWHDPSAKIQPGECLVAYITSIWWSLSMLAGHVVASVQIIVFTLFLDLFQNSHRCAFNGRRRFRQL